MTRKNTKFAPATPKDAGEPKTCGEFAEQFGVVTGDLVTLRSGGPDMTVTYADCVEAECWWFDGAALQQEVFPLEALGSPNPMPF